MIERAERMPHVETLAELASALGITLSQLFRRVNEAPIGGRETNELPLIAYLGTLRLRPRDVEALLGVAKAMFDRRPVSGSLSRPRL